MAIAIAVPTTALCGTSAARAQQPCAGATPGRAAMLMDRAPRIMSAHMIPTRDGGVVVAFVLFRSSRDFPRNRFTVVALDRSGCLRWRESLPGGWPIARPVQAADGSIVAASAALDDPGAAGGLRVYTLAAATGRVVRRDVFAPPAIGTGRPPTLLADRRGNVAVLTTGAQPRAGGRSRPVTVRLVRRPRSARWIRQVVDRSGTTLVAAARPDGRLVVARARRGRLRVRTGTLTGPLGPPLDAGPLGGNYRSSALALGADGTVAAVWEASTYGAPMRVRAAVRPAGAARFARFAQVGFTPGRPNTLFEGSPPAVRVGPGGRATVGFSLLGPPANGRIFCANATPAGRFGASREVAAGVPPTSLDHPDLMFAATDPSAVAISVPNPDLPGFQLSTVGAGCQALRTAPLDPGGGVPAQALIDGRRRTWLFGQPCCTTGLDELRAPLMLTIVAPQP